MRSFQLTHKLSTATYLFLGLLIALSHFLLSYQSANALPNYTFPVIGRSNFSNDFNAPRGNTSNGRHNAIDIFANKHQRIVSATNGTITYVANPQPSWGYMVTIRSDSNYEYSYIHMNNDMPGTDNGRGGPMHAYAPDIKRGNRVVRGQLLGYVGDSGNAENTPPHLHFEVKKPNGSREQPYHSLVSAQRLNSPVRHPVLAGEMLPYGNGFTREVNVAAGDIDGDGNVDLITGAGDGAGPRVKVFDHQGNMTYDFYAFDKNIKRGVDVAIGDVTGNGNQEIIAGSVSGRGPRIAVYKLLGDGQVQKLKEFSTFGKHKGLISVATGDLDGSGVDQIIAGTGIGAPPRVNVFDVEGNLQKTFYAYGADFIGGVNVASGNVVSGTGNQRDDLVVGPGNMSSRVQIFDGDLNFIRDFHAYDKTLRLGARVDVGNIQQQSALSEIATMPHRNGGPPKLKYFNNTGQLLYESFLWEDWWRGNYDVAAADSYVRVGTGINRRGSVR